MPLSLSTSLLTYTGLILPVEIVGLFLFWRYAVVKKRPWSGAIRLCVGLGGVAIVAAFVGLDRVNAARVFCSFLFIHLPVVMLIASGMCVAKRYYLPAVVGAATGLSIGIVGWDAFFIEPTWLEVSRVEIPTPKVDKPVRIAVIADFQTDSMGAYERRVIETVAAQKPDLVLFLGDYLQSPIQPRAELEQEFQAIWRENDPKPPLGAFAVRGNCDHTNWNALFDGLEIETISRTESRNVGPIRLTCLSMSDSSNPRLRLRKTREDKRFEVIAGHCANYMIGDTPGDLLLAGHSHGGQVQVPFLGPLVTLSVAPRHWCAGTLSRRDDGAWVRVSRGTGMERGGAPRLRFWCRPEIVVIDLVPTDNTP